MAIVCFDSSALVKLVVEEAGSDLAAELWDGSDAAVASRLAYPEVRAALAAAGRNHDLDEAGLHAAETAWEEYWAATRPVELTAAVEQHAGRLAGRHALRGANAVHLASALAIADPALILAVWDRRLHAGATAAGLRVAPAQLGLGQTRVRNTPWAGQLLAARHSRDTCGLKGRVRAAGPPRISGRFALRPAWGGPRCVCAAGQEEFHGTDRLGLGDRRGGVANVWQVQVADELKIPAPEDAARLWSLIEAAWAPLGLMCVRPAGRSSSVRAGSQADMSAVLGALRGFQEVLAGRCRTLAGAEPACLDRVAERKLREIDRASIHAVTGGSDDGFLHARGFIVAMGREFCNAVAGNPKMAVPDAECAEMRATSSPICTGNGSAIPRGQAQGFPASRAGTWSAG